MDVCRPVEPLFQGSPAQADAFRDFTEHYFHFKAVLG